MDRVARIVCRISMIVLVALSAPSGASGEGFVDLRVGGSFTVDNDVELSVPGFSVDIPTQYEDSVTGGIRGGYWFDSLPWLGLGADVSYFAPDDDTPGGPEYDVIPVSPLLMGRIPIATSEEYPHGRVQPYLAVGPGVFISLGDFGAGADDESVEVGPDIHFGVNV